MPTVDADFDFAGVRLLAILTEIAAAERCREAEDAEDDAGEAGAERDEPDPA